MNVKGTREKVLYTLLNHPRTTISEIAEAVGINNISVRHHLSALQAENLVECSEERHGVGRPRMVYSLTERGSEKFPTNYIRLAARMLSQIKSSLPPKLVEQMFKSIALELSIEHKKEAKGLTLEGKLDLIASILESEGFSVSWEKTPEGYIIQQNFCPYYRLGREHPEICNLDKTIISTIVCVPVEKISCILHGNKQCTYLIRQTNSLKKRSHESIPGAL